MLSIPELQKHVHVIIQVFSLAEESIDPQQPPGPQHTIPVEQDEIQQLQVDPSVQKSSRMDHIHRVIKER